MPVHIILTAGFVALLLLSVQGWLRWPSGGLWLLVIVETLVFGWAVGLTDVVARHVWACLYAALVIGTVMAILLRLRQNPTGAFDL